VSVALPSSFLADVPDESSLIADFASAVDSWSDAPAMELAVTVQNYLTSNMHFKIAIASSIDTNEAAFAREVVGVVHNALCSTTVACAISFDGVEGSSRRQLQQTFAADASVTVERTSTTEEAIAATNQMTDVDRINEALAQSRFAGSTVSGLTYNSVSAAVSAIFPSNAEAGVIAAVTDSTALWQSLSVELPSLDTSEVTISEVVQDAYVVPPAQPDPPPMLPPPRPPMMLSPSPLPSPPLVVDPKCSAHPTCAALGLIGNCCRTDNGACAMCCDSCAALTSSPPAASPLGSSPADNDGREDDGNNLDQSTDDLSGQFLGNDDALGSNVGLAVVLAIVGVALLFLLAAVIYLARKNGTFVVDVTSVKKKPNQYLQADMAADKLNRTLELTSAAARATEFDDGRI